MIREASSAAFALLTVFSAVAQEPAAVRDPVTEAWLAFRAQHGDTWTAVWNKATETPKAIYGPGLRVAESVRSLADARALSAAVLDEHATLLGRDGSTFVEQIAQKVNGLYVLVYDQRYQGLEVVGGRADVRLRDNGVVAMFGSKAVRFPAGFGTRPQVPMDLAWAVAHTWKEIEPAADAVPTADLVVYADVEAAAPASPRLAWRVPVDVRGGERLVVGKVYVDARTSQAFRFEDEVYHCALGHAHVGGEPTGHEPGAAGDTGGAIGRVRAIATPTAGPARFAAITGNVSAWLQRGDPTAALTNQPMQGLRVNAAGVGAAFTDASGDFSIPHTGTTPVTVTINFGPGSGQNLGGGIQALQGSAVSTSVQVTPGVFTNIQLLSPAATDFEWSQPTVFWHADDAHRWVTSLTGPISTQRFNIAGVRATVNRSSTCNAFYTNNSINFYAAGSGCNMTAYSSVVYHEWGHGLDDAFGGISQTEGLSEGWGDIIATYRLDDPIVGRNFRTNGGFIRDARNSRQYGTGSGAHQQGEIWMGFAWDVRNNLMTALGRNAGIARAEAIVVASIVADATNQEDAVREVFLLDDDDGNLLNGTPSYAQLEAAANRRNMPFPERQDGAIIHTALQATEDQLEPQLVRAQVTAFSGSFSRVELVFDIGGGPVRRDMVRGAGTEYLGLIPGVLSPARVDYHIEATHSSSRMLRYPAAGEIAYSIGVEQSFYSEGFETGAPGWTHAQVRTQDDWQRGAPQGRSGSSGGVSWSDPAGAAAGTAVYANDLGGSGFNGAYQPNAENYLRSPSLNLTGATGVTLRFKRWLTVEEGIYDRATISVNGTQVWVNAPNAHHVDTSWVDVELPLPQADNNPAVQLEWRLRTDGGLNLGGWNIDEVELFSFRALPPPAVTATLTPAQIPLGSTSSLQIQGTANAPGAILLSDSQGPLSIPGLPVLHIGASFAAVPLVLNGSGAFQATITATTDPAARGTVLYGQTIEIAGGAIRTSNKMVMLFGN